MIKFTIAGSVDNRETDHKFVQMVVYIDHAAEEIRYTLKSCTAQTHEVFLHDLFSIDSMTGCCSQ